RSHRQPFQIARRNFQTFRGGFKMVNLSRVRLIPFVLFAFGSVRLEVHDFFSSRARLEMLSDRVAVSLVALAVQPMRQFVERVLPEPVRIVGKEIMTEL